MQAPPACRPDVGPGAFDSPRPFQPTTHIAKQLARIAQRDEVDGVWRCRYCRRDVIRTDIDRHWSQEGLWPERDHVIPRSRGGANEFSNLALSCQPCNTSKHDQLVSELPAEWPRVPAVRKGARR